MLFNNEAGIAFEFTEKGRFSNDVEPPYVIPTISHTPWQAKSFKVPKALEQEVVKIIKDRIDRMKFWVIWKPMVPAPQENRQILPHQFCSTVKCSDD